MGRRWSDRMKVWVLILATSFVVGLARPHWVRQRRLVWIGGATMAAAMFYSARVVL